jgi:hypothetical protein
MAAFDTVNKRKAIMRWRDGRVLPYADGTAFDDREAQMIMRLPGQSDLGPSLDVFGRLGFRFKIGIGF